MWRLVREGLLFYRPVLLSVWVTSTLGVAAILAAVSWTFGSIDGRPFGWALMGLPMYLLWSSGVGGWIVIGSELSEHRLRLHALLPLPLARIALAQLLLPSSMLLLGLALAHAATALAQSVGVAGSIPWLGHGTLDLLAAHILLLLQLTLVGKELTVLRAAGWWRVALGSLVPLLLVAADLAIGLWIGSVSYLFTAAVTALAVLAALFTVTLFCRRSEIAA